MANSAERPEDSPINEVLETSLGSQVKEGDSWQFNKSVLECNRHMLDTGLAADVTFLVSSSNGGEGDVDRFRAHRYMLISRSPVFYSMLCGDLAETGEVTVTDVEPEAFKQMLSYIYIDELDLKLDLVMFILYASKKYLLPGLTTKCTNFLKDNLDASNACTILDQILLFEEAEVAERCMNLIKFQTKAAFLSDSFIDISHATLAKILDSDQLALSEVEVFEASLKWAKQKCEEMQQDVTGINMRKVLGDSVMKFRFFDMKIDEFSRVVGQADILTRDEEVELFRYIANKNSFTPPVGFIDKSRFISTFELRTSETNHAMLIATSSFTIDIQCNADIIHGFVIGTSFSENCSVPGIGTKHVTATLQHINVNGQTYSMPVFQLLDSETQLMKFNSEVRIKSGQSKLVLSYSTGYDDHVNCKGRVYMAYQKEITLKDECIELKLKSNQSYMPLLGVHYFFKE